MNTRTSTFYFDLGSPYAYLLSERLAGVLGLAAPEVAWQPILLGGVFRLTGRSSWALGDAERRQAGMAEIEARAAAYGLPPVRWPDPWPSDYLYAMRAATYALGVGRGVEFANSAFRLAFQRGGDLSMPESVHEAADGAGLDVRELERGTSAPEVKLALREATDEAHRLGVFGVPTLSVGGELFWGDDRLESAAAVLTRSANAG